MKPPRQKKTLRDFNWKVGAKVFALCTVIGAGYAYASQRYVIGLDTQEFKCLDDWIFIIDTWDRPAADAVGRNDLVAVVLTDAQTPANALWKPGQVMVKRAVGTPGDMVDISSQGIAFAHGDAHWTHGTALEAAASLGISEADLTRQLTVAEGALFLMGDNPMSYDGRYYGQVHEDQIVGSVLWSF